MKSVSVRIAEKQAKQLQELANQGGRSINWMVQRGVDLFMAQEFPVYMEEAEATRAKLAHKERQAVAAKGAA
jgi:predicted transcriptional regulator